MKKAGLVLLISLAIASGAHAAPTITLVGDGVGYDETGVNAFRSTNVAKGFDPDSDNVYGSQGLFFFGDGLPDDKGGNPFSTHTQVGAAWATFSQGANFSHVAEGLSYSYAPVDDPNQIPQADVVDWGIRSAGGTASTPAGAGSWCEILKFDIDATTPTQFRIGIMAGIMNNENWNPSGLRVSVDGGTPVAVTNLVGTIGQANFVFFDVDLNGATTGTFSIEAQRRAATQGAAFAGVTFDTTTPGTFPGGALQLSQNKLSLKLVAPDTSTNGIIDALYLAGVPATDVEILSTTADAGFSASVVNTTLGTANTNEAVTVTFDNASVGLANGESTNSTLVVTWTEAGSGVTNTSEAALDVTYINVPSSLLLAPTSLSLILNDPDTSTNGTVTASFVEGTLMSDIIVVSMGSTNADFSASPAGSFSLNGANPTQDITVTYNNTGTLVGHGDTDVSTLVVTWTEAGSGITNASEVALDVFYDKQSQLTQLWTIGVDFGSTAPAGATVFNQLSVGGDASTPGLAADGVMNLAALVDVANTPVPGVGFSVSNATGQIAWDHSGYTGGSGLMTDASVYGDALLSNNKANNPSRPLPAGAHFILAFTGLDDNAIYDLTGGCDRDNANFNSTWSADGQSLTTDGVGGDGYVTLSGLSTDGSGNLVIKVEKSNHVAVSALTLTAYSVAPTEIGPVSMGVIPGNVVLSWGDGRAYTVETNANLIYGNWGVLQSGVSSPATNAIGSESQLFYRLRY